MSIGKVFYSILALAAAFAASGAEWYVDPVNGLDTRDGTTSNVVSATVGPRKTLEKAMELVNAGDTLWLLPGEYNEGSMNSGRARIFVEKKNVKVKSSAGAATTFIVGSGGSNIRSTSAMQCARVANTGVIFEGITFKDGCAQNLGNGVIKDNGGGLGDYTEGSTWAVDCVFTNCWANMGGGMYFGNALRCRFVDCYTAGGDYGCAVSRGKNLAFCLFYNCSTNYATTYCSEYNGNKFYNCTFYGNIGNAFNQDSARHSVLNSIIVGYTKNGSAGMYATNSVMGGASCADTFNCVTGASVVNSGLVSPSEGDFRVMEVSTAASLGDASLLADFPVPTGYSLDRDLAGNAVPSSGCIPAGCLVEARPTRHYYVDCATGCDSNDGTEANPYKTIRTATENAIAGDVIHVAPGTYGEAEGSQLATSSSVVGTRVVIPEGVTVESTGGASNTFIVGALATGDQIDNETYGTGTNAIRCVYANDGATLRGFTLTGGRTIGVGVDGDDNMGSAFYSAKAQGAMVEDCIILNNVAFRATIYQATVRRCSVIGNTGTSDNMSGAAGGFCSWYGAIIDANKGNGTLLSSVRIESCTFVTNLTLSGASSQLLFNNSGNAVFNSLFLYASDRFQGNVHATNCVFRRAENATTLRAENCWKCLFNQSETDINIDSDYRLKQGSVAIDIGDVACSSEALGDTDVYGTPRILNGQIDIGAVEYDWRPTFGSELGQRFKMTYASPTVTTNATGGVKLDGDTGEFGDRALPVCIAGTAASAGPYEFTFELAGGSAQVYVAGVLVDETTGTGEQSIRFNVPDTTSEIRFTFTPDAQNPGTAILRKFSGARGFSISFR